MFLFPNCLKRRCKNINRIKVFAFIIFEFLSKLKKGRITFFFTQIKIFFLRLHGNSKTCVLLSLLKLLLSIFFLSCCVYFILSPFYFPLIVIWIEKKGKENLLNRKINGFRKVKMFNFFLFY